MAVGTVSVIGAALGAQNSRWASAADPTAQALLLMERRWAEAECDGNLDAQTTLADDFTGTAPDGSRYTKEQDLQQTKNQTQKARGCRLGETKVRFFGDNLAVVYGSESRIQKQDEAEHTQTLVWTDTWLKRGGRWQIIAAQDNWGQGK
jgi:hypothetical protein